MNLGAEPKKVAMLGGLLVVGAYFFYSNVLSDSSGAPAPAPAPASKKAVINNLLLPDPATDPRNTPPSTPRGSVVRASAKANPNEEFRPSLKRKPEDAIDPRSIDPRLRLDLLAKVQSVEVAGGARNLFQFSAPPAPDIPKDVPPVKPGSKPTDLLTPPKPADPANTKPTTPPLNLSWKYYGYSSVHGEPKKKAIFLDGEDILTAGEGEVLKRKYRVVRIGVNSVVMEDTDTKSQQTLPLQEEANG